MGFHKLKKAKAATVNAGMVILLYQHKIFWDVIGVITVGVVDVKPIRQTIDQPLF